MSLSRVLAFIRYPTNTKLRKNANNRICDFGRNNPRA